MPTEDPARSSDSAASTISEGRVELLPLMPHEVPEIAAVMAADAEVSPWWGRDASKIEGWLTEDDVYPYRVVVDGQTAGMIEFSEENDPDYRYASIDVALLTPFVGRGVGPDALRALLRYLFADRDHHRVTIDPRVSNARAIRAYEKVGFKPVGVMRRAERDPEGTWQDNLLMEILDDELPVD